MNLSNREKGKTTMSTQSTNPTATAVPAEGTTPEVIITPTLTRAQELADQFMAELDRIAGIIPKLEVAHISTAGFVRAHQSVPIPFLVSSVAAVEQTPELQGLNKLKLPETREALQFIEAFRPVVDKMHAFARNLLFTMNSRKALVASEALHIYNIAKRISGDASSAALATHVENMKRDLGRPGRPRVPREVRKAAREAGEAAKKATLAAAKNPAAVKSTKTDAQ
jgi:hypothetical protein